MYVVLRNTAIHENVSAWLNRNPDICRCWVVEIDADHARGQIIDNKQPYTLKPCRTRQREQIASRRKGNRDNLPVAV